MSTVSEKDLKKELKDLKKLAKKKKDPWAALCAFMIAHILNNEKELKNVRKDASKVPDAEEIEKAAADYLKEKNLSPLKNLGHGMGDLFSTLEERKIDQGFKEAFSKIPSAVVKWELCRDLVRELLEKGDADTALFFLNQVEKVKDPEVWFYTGWAYQIKGIVNRAKDYLEKAAKSNLKEAKNMLADLHLKQGDFRKAASLFEEVGDLEKALMCHLESGNLKEAERIAKEVDSENLKVKAALALLSKGKTGEACRLVEGIETPEAKTIVGCALYEEDPERGITLIKENFRFLTGRLKEKALEVLSHYYEEKGMWKNLTSLLSPLEISGSLSDQLKLKLARGYAEAKDFPRALKILAPLMDTPLKKEAKSLVKRIKKEAEDQQIVSICETILSEDSLFKRLREGLKKSKDSILGRIEALIEDKRQIKEVSIEELEEILLAADVGVEATEEIIRNLKRRIEIGEIKSGQGLLRALEEEILRILKKAEGKLDLSHKPTVIMVVGVNGTGKTTTIAKLGYLLKNRGYSVLFAAGDTFRAAAIEQLEMWGERIGIPVIKQKQGADPSGVVYDAVKAAKARNMDVVIIDTAGRLHTKSNLMEELKKMAKIASKEIPGAPHETLLVLDAVVGQNAISQAKTFSEAIPITGIVMTKLDGTAKGGIIVAIAKMFGIPIKFIGVGERIDDLQEFNAERFVDALFDR